MKLRTVFAAKIKLKKMRNSIRTEVFDSL